MKNFRLVATVLILSVLAFLLFLFPSPLDVFTRLGYVVQVAAAGLLTYGILAWLVPRHINRLAETLNPRELVATTVLASSLTAWAVANLALMNSIQVLFGVDFTLTDHLVNAGQFTVVTAGVTTLYSLKFFIQRWKSSLVLEQELKQAVLKAEFESLKAQVNPHFLFNSLNILSALIPEDPQNAVTMVERMSKVFRYNLQNTEKATVELGEELKIVESYLFIHKMRFADNLRYEIAKPTDDLEKQVVTQAIGWPTSQHRSTDDMEKQVVNQGLLTLVENALKHNECSREKPLTVRVEVADDCVVVTNTLQRKNRLPTDSTGIGLKNLRHRYALLTDREVTVEETEAEFMVKLPLL